jgi:hypothetical protein
MDNRFIISDNFVINESFQSAIIVLEDECGWKFSDDDYMILGKIVPDMLEIYYNVIKDIQFNDKIMYGIVYVMIVDFYLNKKYPHMNLVSRIYTDKN